MRALIAFDKFKDSLTAQEACAVAAEVLHDLAPGSHIETCPLADGGEGFAAILTAAAGGELRTESVTGPRGAPVRAAYGIVDGRHIPAAARRLLSPTADPGGRLAVIEMAAASGLALLAPAERDVWHTGTRGTGELLRAAADTGVAGIVLGVGGSATNDLGLGALAALGLRILGTDGREIVDPVPATWGGVDRLAGQLAPLPPVFIACDVANPLLGPSGAASVYGPQKGLLPRDVPRLDHAAARLALLLCSHIGQPDSLMELPGAGAAGGIAFGLVAGAGARLVGGFDLVSAWLDLDAKIAQADVVITGEGRFDDSSLSGKGPGAVAMRARALGKPVHVFAGTVTASATPVGVTAHAITPAGTPIEAALRDASTNLRRSVREALGGAF